MLPRIEVGNLVNVPLAISARSLLLRVAPILIAVAAAVLPIVATSRYGVAIESDGVSYLAAAHSLVEHRDFRDFEGPYVDWAPLFPCLIALGRLLGLHYPTSALAVNVLAFALMVYAVGIYLLSHERSLFVAAIGMLAVTVAFPIQLVARYVLSEPVFLLLVALSLLALQRYLESGSRRPLLLAAVATSFACVQRYVGVTLIVTGLLLILTDSRRRCWKAAIGFCAISGSLIAIWLVRNVLCTSTLMGSREPSHTSLLQNVAIAAQVLSSGFLPRVVPSLLIVALIIALSFTGKRWVRPPAVFAAVYFAWIVVSSSMVLIDKIDHRYLCPLYLPITLILLGQQGRVLRLAMPLLLLAVPIVSTTRDVRAAIAHGAGGYATDAWIHSGLLRYLRSHPLSGRIYTNEPAASYLFLGRTFEGLPVGPADTGEVYDDMRADAGARPTYLVWYQDGYTNRADLDDVLEPYDAEIVTSQSDGAAYRLRADSDK